MTNFTSVSSESPCEVCGKPDWCQRAGDTLMCRRNSIHPARGFGIKKADTSGADYWLWITSPIPKYSVPTIQMIATPTDSDWLHKVYNDLKLPSSGTHHRALVNRGLTDEQVIELRFQRGYRSLPIKGRARAVSELLNNGVPEHVIAATPGIFIKVNDDGSKCWSIAGSPGMLIPIRDVQRRIVAYQIRSDEPGRTNRYSMLSSKRKGGCGPGSPIHHPIFKGETRDVRITEGPLKADITTLISGMLTLGIIGVSAQNGVIDSLRTLGAESVRLAFDADYQTNKTVYKCLVRLVKRLKAADFQVSVETWPGHFSANSKLKGIDDLLLV